MRGYGVVSRFLCPVLYNIWIKMTKYDKQKAPSNDRAFLREVWYFSRVGVKGFEPSTSCSQSRRTNSLSYHIKAHNLQLYELCPPKACPPCPFLVLSHR